MFQFALLIFFWCTIYVIDCVLTTNRFTQDRYLSWLLNTGISFGLFKIKWFTKRFNKHFQFLGNLSWFPWTFWFNLGVLVSLSSLIFGSALLFLLVFNTFSQRVVEHEILTPVMPGINVPFSEISFMILSIVVAGLVHEVGHAVAAIKEGVRVDGFGIIFFVLYPGAFTSLNASDLEALEANRRLRIYSAGNWHNFVSLMLGFCILKFLPILLLPCYSSGYGVSVSYLVQNSVLTGPLGLYKDDIITRINDCPVMNRSDWFACMQHIKDQSDYTNSGYCLQYSSIRQFDISAGYKARTVWGNIDCCVNQTSSHLCFRYTNNYKFSAQQIFHGPKYACLPVRIVTDRKSCTANSNCKSPNNEPNMLCVSPSLENSTRLIRLVHSKPSPVLFLGDIDELLQTVVVSDFLRRWNFVPSNFPLFVETFLVYLIAISGALILFNSVPCYYLDGQWILQATLDTFPSKYLLHRETRRIICFCLTMFGTLLIITNVTMSLYFMIIKHAGLT